MSLTPDNRLVLRNPHDGKINVLVATGKDSFVDVSSGEKAVFTRRAATGKVLQMLYNDSDAFIKVEE